MPATPDQQAAFEALLVQARPLAGAAADRLEAGLRGIWERADEDRDAVLREIVLQLHELRASLAECDEADDNPGPC